MIEVPSAVMMADIIAKEVDFFSIGTNDLIQYSLAIDRVNKHVAHLYQPLNPGVLRMIQRLNLPVLLGMELDAISMNPISIPAVKRVARMLTVEESKLFLKEALKRPTTDDVIKLVQDTYGPSFPKAALSRPNQV